MAKYLAILKLSILHSLKKSKGLIGLSLFLLTCLLIFAHLWKIAAARIGAADLDPDKLLWYIALNEWILIAIPEIPLEMERDLQSGKLAYLLPRPLSYLGTVFFEGMGSLLVNLVVLGAVSFGFAAIATGGFPCSIGQIGIFFILGAAAGALGLLFKMIVGISAFWLHSVEPFEWIWDKLLFALGGLLLPLSVYPLWLQKIAACTPFPAILGQRSALAIDFSRQEAFSAASALLLWGAFALICLTLLYRRGLAILNVEGG